MTKPEADSLFIEQYYGNTASFKSAVQDDYCAAQFQWSCFIDALCKLDEITQRQWETWIFPGNKYRRKEASRV